MNQSSLLTIDVVDMYNSIPHEEGITACQDALSLHSHYTPVQIDAILALIRLVLTQNCFRFKNSYFLQIRGTAMGTPFAPAYANIFMAYLWRTSISPDLPFTPFWLRRYLDDIIAIFPSSLHSETLLHYLNTRHPSVKFTTSSSSSSVNFLDITVHFSDGKLHTDLYSKPTDSHHYLSPTSSHPKHIFRSIVYGGALRLRRICSRETYFQTRLSELFTYLRRSGYKANFITNIFQEVASKDRTSLLTPSTSSHSDQSRVTFVSTYHPRMHNIRQSHDSHKHLLDRSPKLSPLFPSRPLLALRRTPNLGNILMGTKPRAGPPTGNPPLPPGFHPCGDPRCQIDRLHGIFRPTVKSTVTGRAFPIRQHLHCNSSNVIYVLSCHRCNIQYTGLTTTPLRHRFNNEKSSIRTRSDLTPYGTHFNTPNHSGVTDVRIQCIELVPPESNILERESYWRWQLKTHAITEGG